MAKNRMTYRGQALLEFALILPLIVLIILGTFDLGTAVYANTVISNAAREGARTGIIPGSSDAQVRSAVIGTAIGIPLQNSNIPPITRDPTAGTITVRVVYPIQPFTPLIGKFFGPSGTLTLTAQATMTTE